MSNTTWTDDYIVNIVDDELWEEHGESRERVRRLLRRQRDEMQARITELEAQAAKLQQELAEAGEWEDVPYGEYPDAETGDLITTIVVADNGDGHTYLALEWQDEKVS